MVLLKIPLTRFILITEIIKLLKLTIMKTQQFYVKNQFVLTDDKGVYFQSYNSIICFRPINGPIQLDINSWNYSTTTGKYRNLFLHETRKETEKKIKSGIYLLTDLNK
jgi:hypothetical protein